MKILKIVLASFLMFAITTAFTTNKSPLLTDVDQELLWDGGNQSGADFELGVTSASELNVEANWASAFQTFPTQSCSGTTKICKIRVTYSYTTNDPAPTISEVIAVVDANYDSDGSPSYFPQSGGVYEFTYVDSDTGVTITIQVITKN